MFSIFLALNVSLIFFSRAIKNYQENPSAHSLTLLLIYSTPLNQAFLNNWETTENCPADGSTSFASLGHHAAPIYPKCASIWVDMVTIYPACQRAPN